MFRVVGGHLVRVGHQRDLLQEAGDGGSLTLRAQSLDPLRVLPGDADQFLEVVDPAGILWIQALLQFHQVPRSVQQHLQNLLGSAVLRHLPGAVEQCDEIRDAVGCPGGDSRCLLGPAEGRTEGDPVPAGQRLDARLGPIPDTPAGGVQHPAEADRVVLVDQRPQVGEGVADLLTFVEADATNDLVGQADPDEHLLEDPGLGVGAVEDRHISRPGVAVVDEPVDFSGHPVGLGVLGVGDVADDRVAAAGLAPQPLGFTGGVTVDHGVGGVQDGLGGAVVLLQQDRPGIGEVPLELQDIANRRAPERVDRLVGITHHTQFRRVEPSRTRDQLLDQHVLGVVGVLILVNQHVPKPASIGLRDVRMRLEQVHRRHDQIVEVQRVGLTEPPLIQRVRLGERPLVRPLGSAGERLGVNQLVLQVGDLGGQPTRRIALGVEVQLASDQLHQSTRVVGVIDREGRLHTGVLVLGPQDANTRGVKRRDPHQPGTWPDQLGHPVLHLTSGLVGEGNRDDLTRVHLSGREQVRDPVGEDPGLAGTGAGHDEQR